ncbi:hypothetical protein [Aliarcobacter trophiarum]|uniref:hypothetical protein n=1 Tax=Aliarcobacter trophiarum TaxID=708186 RepID=UPI001472FFA4|nr:hypothetical protein [Aliarcobacter trophiarum]
MIISFFVSCSLKEFSLENKETRNYVKVEEKSFELEDYYIIYALELENVRVYDSAKDVYLKLFINTNKYEYLVAYVTLATQLQDFVSIKEQVSKYFIPNIKEEEILLRLYSFALLKLQEFDLSLETAIKLTDLYKSSINYELLGTVYISKNEFLEAYDSFKKALKYGVSNSLVQAKASLEFFQLNRQKQAIADLKEYILKSDYDFNIALQLLTFYNSLEDKENIKELLKEMFLYYKNSEDALQINKTISLMFQNFEVNEIILFLEKNHIEDDFLLELYKNTKQAEKAYNLLKKLYTNSSNPDYLAQQAIIEFELADNKNSILASVIEKFNISLKTSTNPIYQNFLAYLLIDYDIDISKGLILVKKALEQDPTNIAFIDTLAWGQYKINNCKEAYKNMKLIVDEIGLNDEEIKLHWEKIKECRDANTRKNK